MKKVVFLFVVVALFACAVGFGQIAQTKNLIFNIEYTKPIASVQSLQVVFYVKVTPQVAEATVREAMNLAIKNLPPTVEILGNAWDAIGRQKGDERQISFSNGKSHIVYNPKTKSFSYL